MRQLRLEQHDGIALEVRPQGLRGLRVRGALVHHHVERMAAAERADHLREALGRPPLPVAAAPRMHDEPGVARGRGTRVGRPGRHPPRLHELRDREIPGGQRPEQVAPDRRVVVGHRRRDERVRDERAQPAAIGLVARAEPGDHAARATHRRGQRDRHRPLDEEGLEAEGVERARLPRGPELDEQSPEPRLAHEGDRRRGCHRVQAAQGGHRLEHVAQRARVDD